MTQLQEYINLEPQLLQLEADYGSCLERLTHEEKLAFRAVLSRYLYYREFIDQYSIIDAITDTMPDLDASICDVMLLLIGISDDNAEGLIKFVCDHQNQIN